MAVMSVSEILERILENQILLLRHAALAATPTLHEDIVRATGETEALLELGGWGRSLLL